MAELVEALLVQHYDPVYRQSIRRNFSRYAQATPLALPDISNMPLSKPHGHYVLSSATTVPPAPREPRRRLLYLF
jgi:hypothetical protein